MNLSFRKIMNLAKVEFFSSFLTFSSLIIMIVLLAIHRNNTRPYSLIGYIFLGVFLLFFVINVIFVILITLKINKVEQYFDLKYKGWIYLYIGTIMFYLNFLTLKTLNNLVIEMISLPNFDNFN